jgi:hypothetical protein
MFDDFDPVSVVRAREAGYLTKWAFGPMTRCLRPVFCEWGDRRAI